MTQLLALAGRLSNVLMVIAALFSFGIAFYVIIDIAARNFGYPLFGTAEFIRNAIVAIVFLQLPYCVHSNGMLRADLIADVLPDGGQRALRILGSLLGLLFFGAVAFGAFGPAITAWVNGETEGAGAVRIATWPARFAIVFGCALATAIYLLRALDGLTAPIDRTAVRSGTDAT